MKRRIAIGIVVALGCLVVPYLCRLPYGLPWVNQYRPDDGYFSFGMLFFLVFAIIPSVVTLLSALVSKPPFYFPVLSASLTAFALLIYWHHDNDLAADAQSAITLIFIPIYVAAIAFAAAIIGLIIQAVLTHRTKAEGVPGQSARSAGVEN